MMRSPLSRLIGLLWVTLATVACTPVVHATPNQLVSDHIVGPTIPGTPVGVIAFVDVAVVPMDQEVVLADQTVLVQGGRITAMGPARRVRIPAGAVRIDGRGKYLIPGLSDMHAHCSWACTLPLSTLPRVFPQSTLPTQTVLPPKPGYFCGLPMVSPPFATWIISARIMGNRRYDCVRWRRLVRRGFRTFTQRDYGDR